MTKKIIVSTELNQRLNEVVAGLNAFQIMEHAIKKYVGKPDTWRWSERLKYCAIDCGSEGVFLVDKKTGEIFNTKAYGVPDTNKKAKADVGNVFTVDPDRLYTMRYNYLR